jgi:hypothetical protein
MSGSASKKLSRKRLALGAIGLCIGGLAPLVTGLIGMWQFHNFGYFISKTGDPVEGPLAIVASGMFILAGLGMIAYAIVTYRRKTQASY